VRRPPPPDNYVREVLEAATSGVVANGASQWKVESYQNRDEVAVGQGRDYWSLIGEDRIKIPKLH
jgi:hypothetical protein